MVRCIYIVYAKERKAVPLRHAHYCKLQWTLILHIVQHVFLFFCFIICPSEMAHKHNHQQILILLCAFDIRKQLMVHCYKHPEVHVDIYEIHFK